MEQVVADFRDTVVENILQQDSQRADGFIVVQPRSQIWSQCAGDSEGFLGGVDVFHQCERESHDRVAEVGTNCLIIDDGEVFEDQADIRDERPGENLRRLFRAALGFFSRC